MDLSPPGIFITSAYVFLFLCSPDIWVENDWVTWGPGSFYLTLCKGRLQRGSGPIEQILVPGAGVGLEAMVVSRGVSFPRLPTKCGSSHRGDREGERLNRI